MFKLFTKDLLDRQRIIKYFVYAIISYTLLDGLLRNRPEITFNNRFLIFVAVAFAGSIFYYIRGYVSNDRILSYYALPVSNETLNKNFIFAIIIDSIFSKLVLVFIALYLLKAPFDFYAKVTMIMLAITFFALSINTLNLDFRKMAIIFILTIVSIYIIISFDLVCGGLAVIADMVLAKILFKNIYFSSKNNAKISKLKIANYFLKFAMAESIYIINTISILAMIIFASFAFGNEMGIVIAFAVGAVNTPLLTMFSSSESLRDYDKMLPDSNISLRKDYMKVLAMYFIIVNIFITIINFNKIVPSYLLLINALVLTIIEVLFSYKIETLRPITNTKTQNEIWKHPRKYILPVLVFCISFVILIMLKTF